MSNFCIEVAQHSVHSGRDGWKPVRPSGYDATRIAQHALHLSVECVQIEPVQSLRAYHEINRPGGYERLQMLLSHLRIRDCILDVGMLDGVLKLLRIGVRCNDPLVVLYQLSQEQEQIAPVRHMLRSWDI